MAVIIEGVNFGKGGVSIAVALKNEMIARQKEFVWGGDADLCISAYMETNGKICDPLKMVKAVIDAASRSNLFEADGYMRANDSSGSRKALHPIFKLKNL